ncbi:hypothetical protein [Aureisphaera sp.]
MEIVRLPLVDWSMGAILIAVFGVVVVAMVFIVLSMTNSKNKNNTDGY